ncbi:ferritin-like domain-containing protein [Foetidibacter luteolus]|uniref:ferritin-like domain-containing protein n=1 Tax=Foetidibacter luteolus TaxID=2608880 RepID=UPI00129B36EB|nr:PA2169 family four-helix-bundle protein [Foetidibacter luteolus]
MNSNENNVDILNDLIRINNDRITGYQKALEETDIIDGDLKVLFNRMIDESQGYVDELSREVVALGGEVATGTTTPGKIYRAWMDVKNTFTGNDRHAILSSCEYGEDAAQKAYKEALEDNDLSANLRSLVSEQKASLLQSHNTIKSYRDLHKAVS